MKAIKDFNEFVKEGIVKKQSPDKSRAEFLMKVSENGYSSLNEYLNKIGINENNANDYVKSCYDILMEVLRAKMLLDGYNASGFNAHNAEVSYTRKLKLNEADVQFLDEIRSFRNGTLYYGTILDEEYTRKVIAFTKRIYPKLLELMKF